MTSEAPILVEQHGRRLELVLNRPDRKNSLIGPLVEALRDAVLDAAEDDSVGCILLRGAGGVFCSGLDLKAFGQDPEPDMGIGAIQLILRQRYNNGPLA